MLGALITLVFSLGAMGLGLAALARWLDGMDPAARFGIGGLVGLGALGLVTLPIGLIPGGLNWGVSVIVLLALAGGVFVWKDTKGKVPITLPNGLALLFPVAITAAALFSFIGVLAPSDSFDWDSLAYHLAVPKLWLHDGQIHYISFIHHSNFPFTIDNLYIWGLLWGDQQGAKAFSFAFLLFGLVALFGLARQRYGGLAGWWSALAFVTIPAVVWLSGTAYIDVSNGLYSGLGILFAAWLVSEPQKNRWAWLSAIFLGLAAGSKFTGLQTIIAVGFVVLLYGIFGKSRSNRAEIGEAPESLQATNHEPRAGLVGSAFLIGLVALAIASPWYLKNLVLTGNPVFPFFYSVFGGKNWSAFNAFIYNEEQKSFGVGSGATQLGNAILGLAYQPGRYTNPNPAQGVGFPFAALGVVGLCTALVWCFGGKMRRFEGAVIGAVGINLLMWFYLSQQSRYIIALSIPLCVLAGGAIVRLRVGPVLAAIVGLQAAFSLWLLNTVYVGNKNPISQIEVALGKVTPDEYLAKRLSFSEPAKAINGIVKNGRVALYDQVFGYLLDVPYIWANPGHSTELGYESMQNGDDLIASFKKAGITYVWLDFSPYGRSDATFQRWLQAMALTSPNPIPYEGKERADMASDQRTKWKVLVAEAAAGGKLVPVRQFPRGVLFALR